MKVTWELYAVFFLTSCLKLLESKKLSKNKTKQCAQGHRTSGEHNFYSNVLKIRRTFFKSSPDLQLFSEKRNCLCVPFEGRKNLWLDALLPTSTNSRQSATLEPNSAFDWLWESIVGVKHCSKTINMSMLSCPKWIEWNNVSDLSHL